MDSTAALQLEDVPDSLLVIGGGYIGLEMGTVYAELGSRVSVVELTDGLLPGADQDLVKPLHKRLKGLFEAMQLNTKVVGLKKVATELRFFRGARWRDQFFEYLSLSVADPTRMALGWKTPMLLLTQRVLLKSINSNAPVILTFLRLGCVRGADAGASSKPSG